MSDNLKKKKQDAKRISQQPWEQAYQRRKATLRLFDKLTAQGKKKKK